MLVAEALTYRLEEEEIEWRKRDPLPTFEGKVTEQGLMEASELEQIREAIEIEVDEAVEFGLNSPLPTADELYDHVYVSYPNSLAGLH